MIFFPNIKVRNSILNGLLLLLLPLWVAGCGKIITRGEAPASKNNEEGLAELSPDACDEHMLKFLIARALGGDQWAAAYIRDYFPFTAIDLYARYFQENYRLSESSINDSIQFLEKGSAIKRAQAFAHLLLLPEAYRQKAPQQIKDIELDFMQGGGQPRMVVARELSLLCSNRLERTFERDWELFRCTPRDPDMMFLFSCAPFDSVWKRCRLKPAEERVVFLLLRLFTRSDDEKALKELGAYTAEQLISHAKRTWWPCVIAEPEQNGAYIWATLAEKVADNTSVCNVLRLSIKPPDYYIVKQRGDWVHLDRWSRWTYLLTMKEMCANREALVYAEGQLRGCKGEDLYRSEDRPLYPILWFPKVPDDRPMPAEGDCIKVLGVPASIRVPAVDLSEAEWLDWCQSNIHEWTKQYVPKDIAKLIRFTSNTHPVPEVIPIQSSPGGHTPPPSADVTSLLLTVPDEDTLEKEVVQNPWRFIRKYSTVFKMIMDEDVSALSPVERRKLLVLSNNLGTGFIRTNRYQESIPFLEKAVAIDPEDPLIQRNIGLALHWSYASKPDRQALQKALLHYQRFRDLDQNKHPELDKEAEVAIAEIRQKLLINNEPDKQ